ncbi:sulfite exporter TauE/SafE family protein [Plastorhodobacter daqingensis]|uniref:Probable membrane transporter protein n=1 Tax=Plastorhodobacter daqingensis TaxID=1387281 RepID=A0ABW2UJS7_9RHOB
MVDLSVVLPMLGLLLVIGAFAGVIAGLLGVGGGIVLVPAFFYAFSAIGYGSPQLMQICLATSLATIIVTSMRSLSSHNKKGAVDWPVLKQWAPGIMIGALVGVAVAAQLSSTVLQGIFGGLGLLIGIYFIVGSDRWRIADQMPGLITRSILSPVVGVLSVLMGIGGGSFAVPIMTLYGAPIHRAVATASGFGLIIALPSVLAFLFVPIPEAVRPPFTIGAVNLPAFFITIITTMYTATLGVRLAHAMDPKPLKRVFAVFLIAVALNMIRKSLGY